MKQFTGWTVRQLSGGALEWTSETGRIYSENAPTPAVAFTPDSPTTTPPVPSDPANPTEPPGPPAPPAPPEPPTPPDAATDPPDLDIPIDPDPDALDRFFELLEIELGRHVDLAPDDPLDRALDPAPF